MSCWRQGDVGYLDSPHNTLVYHRLGETTARNETEMELHSYLDAYPGHTGAFLSDFRPLYWYADKDIFTFRPRLVE